MIGAKVRPELPRAVVPINRNTRELYVSRATFVMCRSPGSHCRIDSVYGVALTPDGRWGITACRDSSVRVWEFTTGKPVMPPLRVGVPGTNLLVNALVTPDGRHAVLGVLGKGLLVLDLGKLATADRFDLDDLCLLGEVASGQPARRRPAGSHRRRMA